MHTSSAPAGRSHVARGASPWLAIRSAVLSPSGATSFVAAGMTSPLGGSLVFLLSMYALMLLAAPASAQNPFDDFADESAVTDDAPADEAAADEPAAAAPAEAPAAAPPPANAPILADFARREPAVAAVLDLPRETPAQKLRAVTMLVDLGHPDVATLILPEL